MPAADAEKKAGCGAGLRDVPGRPLPGRPCELRNPENQYHFVTVAEANDDHAPLRLDGVLRGPGRGRRQGLLAAAAGLLRPAWTGCSPHAGGRLEGLPGVPRHRRRRAVPVAGVPGRELRLQRQDPERPARAAAAVEARPGHGQRQHGPGAGPTLRGPVLPARGQGARQRARRQRPQRPQGAHPEPRLDERRDQGEGAGQVGQVPAQDRVPGHVAGLVRPDHHARQLLRRRHGGGGSSTTSTTRARSASPPTATSGA